VCELGSSVGYGLSDRGSISDRNMHLGIYNCIQNTTGVLQIFCPFGTKLPPPDSRVNLRGFESDLSPPSSVGWECVKIAFPHVSTTYCVIKSRYSISLRVHVHAYVRKQMHVYKWLIERPDTLRRNSSLVLTANKGLSVWCVVFCMCDNFVGEDASCVAR